MSMWLASIAPVFPSPLMMLITPIGDVNNGQSLNYKARLTWREASFLDQSTVLQDADWALLGRLVDEGAPRSNSSSYFESKEDGGAVPGTNTGAHSDRIILDDLETN